MASTTTSSIADIADRHRRLMAIAALGVSILYAASAAEHVVPPDLVGAAEAVAIAGALVALAFAGRIMIWKFRHLGGDNRHLYFDTEGYVANAIARAHVASWGTTFFLLIALAAYGDRFPQLPSVFFLQLTLAVMSAVFAGTVLVLTRADDEEPEEAGVA